MTTEEIKICGLVDHTNLSKKATEFDIEILCKQAIQYGAKSVCVPPHFVQFAEEKLRDSSVLVCTVIGFPNGYSATLVKEVEAKYAILCGANEIDVVLNINMLKDKKYDKIQDEISKLANICHECQFSHKPVTLKVIVETCLLTQEEKKTMCDICINAGADYIKTSTGFDKAGANIDDVRMMKEYIGDRGLKIKASGGIKTMKDAKNFIEAGADRIGASSLFGEVRERERTKPVEDMER